MSNHPDLENLPPLREVIAAHDLRAEKKFGQNFLLDQNITDKIARVAAVSFGGALDSTPRDLAGINVVEIGPGPGGLTRSLLRAGAARVVAVEFDPRAVKALEDLQDAACGRLEIVSADALEVDISTLVDAPRMIAANLPYNIATPLLLGWLKQIHTDQSIYQSMTLMFQKEVAERIVAKVGDKAYGRLAIIARWLCHTKKAFDLPPNAFIPPPKVKSSIVHFTVRDRAGDEPSFEAMEALSAAAFGQRRKMIRTSLKDYSVAIEALGLDPTMRAENLDVEDYIALARIGVNAEA